MTSWRCLCNHPTAVRTSPPPCSSEDFAGSNAGVAPAATIRVDLTPAEDELRARLTRRLRTWTRQWPQRGVTVRVADQRDIPILARLATETARFQGFTPFPADYLDTTYRRLCEGGHAVLLIGELHDQPVAAELVTSVGGVLKSRVSGLDRTSREAAKLNVASAMIWEAIRWGNTTATTPTTSAACALSHSRRYKPPELTRPPSCPAQTCSRRNSAVSCTSTRPRSN